MARYQYTAKDLDGNQFKGIMEAPNEEELYHRLKLEDKFLVKSFAIESKNKAKKIKANILSEFCRELGTLLGSGISLVRALNIIAQSETIKPWQREIYLNVLQLIRQGIALSDAMEQQEGAFPELMLYMFRSAELSGNLDQVALRMADHYRKDFRLNSKIKNAMIYPIVILITCLAAVIVLVTFVIPMFSDMFALMETLPLPTRMVMALSDMFKYYWYLLIIGVAVFVCAIHIIFSQPPVRLALDRFKVRIPVAGKLLSIIYTARFARTLSSLYSSGLPIVGALQVGKKTIGNAYIESQFDDAIAAVRRGDNLSEAIGKIDGFSRKLSSVILIGEETGSLDTMLINASEDLDYEAENSIEKLLTLLQPLLIIFMAIVVIFILLAILLPVFGSYGAIENSSGVY